MICSMFVPLSGFLFNFVHCSKTANLTIGTPNKDFWWVFIFEKCPESPYIYINIILFFFFFFFCFYWFYAIVHMFMLFFSTLSNGFFSLTLRKGLSSFYIFLHIVYNSKKPWTMNNWGFMRVVDQKSLNKNMNKRVQNTEHGNTRTPKH